MALVRVVGLTEAIIKVLTNEWQPTAVIASQLDIPPDAIARFRGKESSRRGYKSSESAAKAYLVATRLSHKFKRGSTVIERRPINRHMYEYRLISVIT